MIKTGRTDVRPVFIENYLFKFRFDELRSQLTMVNGGWTIEVFFFEK